MDVVIDIGNTDTKIAFFIDKKQSNLIRFATTSWQSLYLTLEAKEINALLVASVVEVPKHIITYLNMKAKKVFYLNEKVLLPFKNSYQSPQTLGADRLSLAAAATILFPKKPVLILSTGTCLTTEFINAKQEYLGGSISPGLQMRLDAMNVFTDKLPKLKIEKTNSVTGRDTITSMQSGAYFGMLYEMNGFINHYKQNNPELEVILTGGNSYLFDKKLIEPTHYYPDLTLTGLYTILQYQLKNENKN